MNAYEDAAISEAMLRYLKTGQIPVGPEPECQRAAELIQQTPDDALKPQRVVTQAFCQYAYNGYADIMPARFIEEVVGLHVAFEDPSYTQYETGPIDMWYFFAPGFQKDMSQVIRYAWEKAGIELTLTYEQIGAEVMRVQNMNVAANRTVHDLLLNGKPTNQSKVLKLRRMAQRLCHPETFIRSAADTLQLMEDCDKLGRWVVKLVTRN